MSVCPADMAKCDKKARCAFGPNEGVAYNPQSPCGCQGGCDFDAGTCDCICDPRGVYLVSSINNTSYPDGSQDPPSLLMAIGSYFDSQGDVIERRFAIQVNGAWTGNACNSGVDVRDEECQNYSGTLSAVHDNECSGGGSNWASYSEVFYINGVYDTFNPQGGFRSASGSQCNAPIGSSSSVTLEVRGL